MNWINKIISLNSRLFSKAPQTNSRFLVAIILLVYFLAIFISSFFMPSYTVFWQKLGVGAELPIFGDLRVITSGWECHRFGYDVTLSNPCYRERLAYTEVNYPRIWMSLAYLGLTQEDTVLIGTLIVFLFFYCFFLLIPPINYIESFVYSLILCSPSIMQGVERGNNDLIIFIIFTIVIFLVNKHQKILNEISYLIILFASILKFYPIFGLAIVLKENKKNAVIISGFILTLFIIYLLLTWDHVQMISNVTPRYDKWSYGYKIIFNILSSYANSISSSLQNNQHTFNLIGLFNKIYLNNIIKIFLITLFFILQIILLSGILIVTKKNIKYDREENLIYQNIYMNSFRLGASIYVGTFLLGNNWSYRLMFLIFTIPQILHWIKNIGQLTILSNLALVSMILTLFMKTIVSKGLWLYFNQFIDWFLFFYFIYSLLITLPDWFKSFLGLWKIPINLFKTQFILDSKRHTY